MYHEISLLGRLGRDPEMRYLPDGKAVCDFSIAVDDGFGDKKETLWFKVATWSKTAEACNQYLHKGDIVFVQGRMQHSSGSPRVWQDSNGNSRASFEVTARDVKFIQTKKSDQPQSSEPVSETEIPF